MARPARTRRQKREPGKDAAPAAVERVRERRRQIRPLAPPKSQAGARRERRGGFRQFTLESWAELGKVEWPRQRQLISASVVVIIAVAVVGFYLWVADEAFSRLVRDVLLGQ